MFLPKDLRGLYCEDLLLDAILQQKSIEGVTEVPKLRKIIAFTLWKCIEKTDALIAGRLEERLFNKALLFLNGIKIDGNEKLVSLLKLAEKANKDTLPLLVVAKNQDGDGFCTIRIPRVDMNDGLNIDNIGLLMKFTSALLRVKLERIKLLQDSDLGDSISINKSQNTIMENLISSSQQPSGIFLGDIYSFPNGFQANLPGILAAMSLFSKYKQYLRVKPKARNESKSLRVNYSDLQETFNLKSGLKGKNDFVSLLMKETFKILVGPSTRNFPGGWVHSLRNMNKTKSTVGILFHMGWVEITPLKSKIYDVIYNTVIEKEGGRKSIINYKKLPRGASFLEFRTAVAMLMPMIDPESEIPLKDQISVDPLRITDENILAGYTPVPQQRMVDKLNHANALKQSVAVSASKTRPVHYEMARNELLHLSDKVKITDARGTIYPSHQELPKKVFSFLKDQFSFTLKREREGDDKLPKGKESEKPEGPKRSKAIHKKFSELPVRKVAGEDLSPNTMDVDEPSVVLGQPGPSSAS
jgi:hypothetical protein